MFISTPTAIVTKDLHWAQHYAKHFKFMLSLMFTRSSDNWYCYHHFTDWGANAQKGTGSHSRSRCCWMEFLDGRFSTALIYSRLWATYFKWHTTLLRMSLVISKRIWSALPEEPVCLEPPWVRSKDSKRIFVCWRSLEISTFSCNPNISGCWVNGSFYQKID